MTDRVVVHRGSYHDSITLMVLTRDVQQVPGVLDAAVVAGTPLNLGLLAEQGFAVPAGPGSTDLVIAVRAKDDESAASAVEVAERGLAAPGREAASGSAVAAPPSLTEAARRDSGLSLAFISVPGSSATYEIASALEAGLNVFCFSSGPTIEEEAQLKARAIERGLLLMGPDCGTAIVDGVGLGFANAVRPGPVGIVGASGTGTQELLCLLDAAGVGVSQVIGVGGRDLRAEVGGAMTMAGLARLAADPATEIVAVVSKPPDADVAAVVRDAAARTGKPAVLALLVGDERDVAPGPDPGYVVTAASVERAATLLARLAGAPVPASQDDAAPAATPGYIRGLFCGGSLCSEAMAVVAGAGAGAIVVSNVLLHPHRKLADVARSQAHTFIDFGEESLTEGRAHPMIDPSLRDARLVAEAADPAVGVIVVDVVLGYGAHPDPAGELAPRIREALRSRGSTLTVIASVCGTGQDPQGLADQIARLRGAGALVTASAAHAGRLALQAAGLAP